MNILPNGDRAIMVQFPEEVSPQLNQQIQQFCFRLEHSTIQGMEEWVPAYNTVTIYYDPTTIQYADFTKEISELFRTDTGIVSLQRRIIHVPVLYGGKTGPDLERLAEKKNVTPNEIIHLHTKPTYLVYMIGFLPGFPYLGGLDKRLAMPRLKTPRPSVAAGSVGIAHEQTGIYSLTSPGGWNIIGQTPLTLFHPDNEANAFLFQPGDAVKFYAITEEEFNEMKQLIANNEFEVKVEMTEEGIRDEEAN